MADGLPFVDWLRSNKDLLGYLATSLFTLSFIVKSEANLLRAQMLAAGIWLIYGILIGATPVIVANALVAGGAIYKQILLGMNARRNRIVT